MNIKASVLLLAAVHSSLSTTPTPVRLYSGPLWQSPRDDDARRLYETVLPKIIHELAVPSPKGAQTIVLTTLLEGYQSMVLNFLHSAALHDIHNVAVAAVDEASSEWCQELALPCFHAWALDRKYLGLAVRKIATLQGRRGSPPVHSLRPNIDRWEWVMRIIAMGVDVLHCDGDSVFTASPFEALQRARDSFPPGTRVDLLVSVDNFPHAYEVYPTSAVSGNVSVQMCDSSDLKCLKLSPNPALSYWAASHASLSFIASLYGRVIVARPNYDNDMFPLIHALAADAGAVHMRTPGHVHTYSTIWGGEWGVQTDFGACSCRQWWPRENTTSPGACDDWPVDKGIGKFGAKVNSTVVSDGSKYQKCSGKKIKRKKGSTYSKDVIPDPSRVAAAGWRIHRGSGPAFTFSWGAVSTKLASMCLRRISSDTIWRHANCVKGMFKQEMMKQKGMWFVDLKISQAYAARSGTSMASRIFGAAASAVQKTASVILNGETNKDISFCTRFPTSEKCRNMSQMSKTTGSG